jgi:glycosyltransferase involved in cell wall biosynthesis
VAERPVRILQVSTRDLRGGAEKVAWELFQTFRARGYDSWLAVGYKRSNDPNVLIMHNYGSQGVWSKCWWQVYSQLQSLGGRLRGAWRLSHLVRRLAEPKVVLDAYRGLEDFRFPGTWQLLRLIPEQPDIVHCHNLHGGYFDLRSLPSLGQQVPVMLTLHDAWLLSGHCSHSFDCERWKTGCGDCPDLSIYPAIRKDATAYNWRRKQAIYAKSRLYVATPCRWLMQKVEQSMLAPSVAEARVIPYGVDLSVFQPGDRRAARAALDLPQDAVILLFTANGIRRSRWKDYQTMRAAVAQLAARLHGQRVLFIALGEDAPTERSGQAEVCFVPYQQDRQSVARYYQASDVYVHAAKVDTFPNTVLEALACGTPVVATAVGGIPEQVKGLAVVNNGPHSSDLNRSRVDDATGILVSPGDAKEMAHTLERLVSNTPLRCRLSANAARDAQLRFDLNRQVDAYLDWYEAILQRSKDSPQKGGCLALAEKR